MPHKNEDRALADLERQLVADAPELQAAFDTFARNCGTEAYQTRAWWRYQDNTPRCRRLAILVLLVGLMTTIAGAAVLLPLVSIGIALMLASPLMVAVATRRSRARRTK